MQAIDWKIGAVVLVGCCMLVLVCVKIAVNWRWRTQYERNARAQRQLDRAMGALGLVYLATIVVLYGH